MCVKIDRHCLGVEVVNCIVHDEDDYGSLTGELWSMTGDPKHSDRLSTRLSNDRFGSLRTDGVPKPQKPTSNAVDRPESKGLVSAYYSEILSPLQIYAIFLRQ